MNNEQQPVETSSEKSRGTKRPAPHAIVQLLPDSIISSDGTGILYALEYLLNIQIQI